MTKSYYLATALKISIIASIDDPDTVSVKVVDPGGSTVQAYASASKLSARAYEYIYQSLDTGCEGEYIITIKITSGEYTSIEKIKVTLLDK